MRRDMGEQQQELVITVAHQRIAAAAHTGRDRTQHGADRNVAGLTAVGLVDCAEMVEVKQQDAVRLHLL